MAKDPQKTAAIQEHKAARKNLEKVSSKITEETPEYLAANDRVIAAEKNVSWWRR